MRKLALLVALAMFAIGNIDAGAEQTDHKYKDYSISGPYAHENLAVFLIHGKSAIDAKNILTLDEAMEKKKIVVYETGSVDKLAVENISDTPVYIQSGDIVKGGKQDRVLQNDLVIRPKSGKIPISSFCVEQGRWAGRGKEDRKSFGSSKKQLASRKLKLATKRGKKQGDVWKEVASVQKKLTDNVGKSVQDVRSATSLQLTLENKEISKKVKDYTETISGMVKNQKDAIGFCFAINGEINSADLYASTGLFQKLWPKMLEACSVEAVSELNQAGKTREVTANDVANWLNEADKGKESEQSVNENIDLKVRESDRDIVYETYDDSSKDIYIHKNVLKK